MFNRAGLRTAIYIILGALANVAVAWACSIAMGEIQHSRKLRYRNPVGDSPVVYVTKGISYESISVCPRGGTILARERVPRYPRHAWWNEDSLWYYNWAVAHGFPVASLSAWRTTWIEDTPDGDGLIRTPVLHWGVALGEIPPFFVGGRIPVVLALRPVWPGFTINTLLYAGLLWLLIRGRRALRRFIRHRRGQCLVCAYPTGSSPVCTECGGRSSEAQVAT